MNNFSSIKLYIEYIVDATYFETTIGNRCSTNDPRFTSRCDILQSFQKKFPRNLYDSSVNFYPSRHA